MDSVVDALHERQDLRALTYKAAWERLEGKLALRKAEIKRLEAIVNNETDLRKDLEKAQDQLKVMKDHRDGLLTRITTINDDKSVIFKEVRALRGQIKDQEGSLQAKTDKITSLTAMVKSRDNDIRFQLEAKKDLVDKINITNREIDGLKHTLSCHEVLKQARIGEVKVALQNVIDTKVISIRTLEAELFESKREIEKLRHEYAEKSIKCDELLRNLESETLLRVDTVKEHNRLSEKYENAKSDMKFYQERLEDAKSVYNRWHGKYCRMSNKYYALQRRSTDSKPCEVTWPPQPLSSPSSESSLLSPPSPTSSTSSPNPSKPTLPPQDDTEISKEPSKSPAPITITSLQPVSLNLMLPSQSNTSLQISIKDGIASVSMTSTVGSDDMCVVPQSNVVSTSPSNK